MNPIFHEVESIGAGKLSVMPMPASGEEVAGLQQLGIDHVVSLLEVGEQSDVGLADEEALCVTTCSARLDRNRLSAFT
jgi:hypothetical protein